MHVSTAACKHTYIHTVVHHGPGCQARAAHPACSAQRIHLSHSCVASFLVRCRAIANLGPVPLLALAQKEKDLWLQARRLAPHTTLVRVFGRHGPRGSARGPLWSNCQEPREHTAPERSIVVNMIHHVSDARRIFFFKVLFLGVQEKRVCCLRWKWMAPPVTFEHLPMRVDVRCMYPLCPCHGGLWKPAVQRTAKPAAKVVPWASLLGLGGFAALEQALADQ